MPIEGLAGAVKAMIEAGRVKHFGMSEPGLDTLRRAHAVQKVTAVQNEYSIWWRRPETTVLPARAELGIGFVPFSPLGNGYLTVKIDAQTKLDGTDFRNTLPRFTAEARRSNQALIDGLNRIAYSQSATPAQIALAWLLAPEPWIVPIPGTTKADRLDENVDAAAIGLDTDDLEAFEAVLRTEVLGSRYSEAAERMAGVESRALT